VPIVLLQCTGFAGINAVTAEQAFTGHKIDNGEIAASLVDDVGRALVNAVTAAFT